MIAFECKGCGALFRFRVDQAGKKGKCPKCGAQFIVPMPDDEAVNVPPPSAPPTAQDKWAFVRRRPPVCVETRKRHMPVFLAACGIVVLGAILLFTVFRATPKKPRSSLLEAAMVPIKESKPGADYDIKFTRPHKVGQVFEHTDFGSSRKNHFESVNGNTGSKKEDLEFERAGTEEVLEINERGQPTQVAFTVDKCVLIQGDHRTEAAPKGLVVIVSAYEGKPQVRAKDPNASLSADAVRIFEEPGFVDSAEADDDEAFGTQQRRRIGESWPVQAEYVANWFSSALAGADVKKRNVSGTVTLVGLVKVAGIDCLHLRVDLNIKDAAPPGIRLAGDKAELTVSASMTEALPLDTSLAVVGGRTVTSITMRVRNEVLNPVGPTLETTLERTVDGTGVPLKK